MCIERYTEQMETIRKQVMIVLLDKVGFMPKNVKSNKESLSLFVIDRMPLSSPSDVHALIPETCEYNIHEMSKGTLQMQLML